MAEQLVNNLTFSTWLEDNSKHFDDLNNATADDDLFDGNQTYSAIYIVSLKIIKWLNLYYLGFIIIIGVLGNGYNFISFLRTSNKLQSPSYYLAALSLADATFLLTIFIVWIGHTGLNLFFRRIFFYVIAYVGAASSCISGIYIIDQITGILLHFSFEYSLVSGSIHIRTSDCRPLSIEKDENMYYSKG